MSTEEKRPPLRAVLVEDSPYIAERMRELLQQEGVDVLASVDDEAAAISAVRESAVDLLILDLRLRTGTGFGVLAALGDSRPFTVVMTNYALPQYREQASRYGVEYFLNKAKDFELLPQIIADLRGSR